MEWSSVAEDASPKVGVELHEGRPRSSFPPRATSAEQAWRRSAGLSARRTARSSPATARLTRVEGSESMSGVMPSDADVQITDRAGRSSRRARPAESDPCSREARASHCGERRERARSLECTCTRGDDDALRWRCIQMTAFEW